MFWLIHPRSKKQLEILVCLKKLNLPKILLTDSGGLQEECTILGTPCLTLITLQKNGGANILIGNNIERIQAECRKIINKPRILFRPELWDGKAAERCLDAILNYIPMQTSKYPSMFT